MSNAETTLLHHHGSSQKYDIDFQIYYGDQQQHQGIIYRDDGSNDEIATLSITSTSEIPWSKPSDSTPSATNCHFFLQVDKGLLANYTAVTLDNNQNWTMSAAQSGAHTYLYLLNTQSGKLGAATPLLLCMNNFLASSNYNNTNTSVTLSVGSLWGQGTASHTISIKDLPSGNTAGANPMPLAASMVSSNAVLNDGKTSNSSTVVICQNPFPI